MDPEKVKRFNELTMARQRGTEKPMTPAEKDELIDLLYDVAAQSFTEHPAEPGEALFIDGVEVPLDKPISRPDTNLP